MNSLTGYLIRSNIKSNRYFCVLLTVFISTLEFRYIIWIDMTSSYQKICFLLISSLITNYFEMIHLMLLDQCSKKQRSTLPKIINTQLVEMQKDYKHIMLWYIWKKFFTIFLWMTMKHLYMMVNHQEESHYLISKSLQAQFASLSHVV